MVMRQRSSATTDADALRGEVDELKALVKELAGQVGQVAGAGSREHTLAHQQPTQKLHRLVTPGTRDQEQLLHLLWQRGIGGETAETIAAFTREQLNSRELFDKSRVNSFLIDTIADLLEVSPPDLSDTSRQHRLALIGPTGVGKTTTLAKLAAHYLAEQTHSIALITIDTYRIAAVEQLKVYGDIMHLPVEVVLSPEQLEAALLHHADKSLILLDTAGRSPRDNVSIRELATFLRPDLEFEKHLVLSAGTREDELMATIQQFQQVGFDKTLFTKLDECSNNGIILNVQVKNPAPLSFFTNGQRVPEDLLPITKRTAAALIMSANEG